MLDVMRFRSILLTAALAGMLATGPAPSASGAANDASARAPWVLGSADFLGARSGFVTVGDTRTNHGYLYETSDGGSSWTRLLRFPIGGLSSPQGGLLPTSLTFLNSRVGFLSTQDGSLTGTKEWVRGLVYRTTDGGRKWQRFVLPHERWGLFDSVSFVSRNQGWLLISSHTTMAQSSLAVFHTADGGKKWSEQAIAGYGPHAFVFKGGLSMGSYDEQIHFSSKSHGWIFGENGVGGETVDSFTTNGGKTWGQCAGRHGPIPKCGGPGAPARFFKDGRRNGGSGQVFVTQLDNGDFFDRRGLLPVVAVVPSWVTRGHFKTEGGYFMYHLGRSMTFFGNPTALRLPMGYGFLRPPVADVTSPTQWYFANNHVIASTANGGRTWTRTPAPLPGGFFAGGLQFIGRTGYVWGGSLAQGPNYSIGSLLERTDNGGKSWTRIVLPTR
jgi:photosystem II stability/assembly factor-like uncharacterized protein